MPQITIVLQYKIFIKNSAGAAEKFRRACAFNYTAPPPRRTFKLCSLPFYGNAKSDARYLF